MPPELLPPVPPPVVPPPPPVVPPPPVLPPEVPPPVPPLDGGVDELLLGALGATVPPELALELELLLEVLVPDELIGWPHSLNP